MDDRIVYGSKSNVIVADDSRAVSAICLGGDVNAVSCRDGVILAGCSEGSGYVIEECGTTKHSFGASIMCVGFMGQGLGVFCTMENTFIYDIGRKSVRHKIENRWIPTCTAAVGSRLYLGSRKGSVFVVYGEEFKVVCEMMCHADSIQDIKTMELDEEVYVATSSQDETVKIWRLVDGGHELSHVQTLNGHTDWVYGLCWTDEGDLLSSSGDCSIIFWKRRELWENTMRLGGSGAFLNVMSIGGSIVGQSYSGGFYKFQDELRHYISGHTDGISSIDWRGDFVLTASLDMTARIFHRGTEVGRPQIHGYPLTSARFLNEDDLSFISSAQETILRVYEPTQVFYMCCSYISDDPTVCVDGLDISSSRRPFYELFGNIEDLKLVAVPAELSLTNEVVDDFEFESLNEQLLSTTAFNEVRKVYGHYFGVSGIAVSKDFVVSCNKSLSKKFGGIFVWSRTLEPVQYIEEHEYGVERLVFSPDGRYLAAVSKDKTASVYRVGERIEMMCRLRDHKRIVWDCSFSHDSGYLATCSRDRTVVVYKMPECSKSYSMKVDSGITSLCFSPIEAILVLGLECGDIMMVEVSGGLRVLNRSREHSRQVSVIQFSPDGSRYASGGADGMLKVFPVN